MCVGSQRTATTTERFRQPVLRSGETTELGSLCRKVAAELAESLKGGKLVCPTRRSVCALTATKYPCLPNRRPGGKSVCMRRPRRWTDRKRSRTRQSSMLFMVDRLATRMCFPSERYTRLRGGTSSCVLEGHPMATCDLRRDVGPAR